MQHDFAVMFVQKFHGLESTCVVIGIDAGDKLIFTLNGNHRNMKICKLPGGDGMTEDDQPLDLIGQKLLNIPAFGFFVIVSEKNKKFVTVFFIRKKNPVQYFGIVSR